MNATAKILVVDDQDAIQRCASNALAGAHCQVEAASNGIEALHAMERELFDVVLLDQSVPAVDGMPVLEALRNKWPDCEVIVFAARPTIDSAKKAIQLGAYDYLTTPISPSAVINAANGAMTHKKWTLRMAA